MEEVENILIIEAVRDFQRGCQKIVRAIEEDPYADPDVIEFLSMRVSEVRDLCDLMYPPQHCFQPNVIPFVPKTKTG